MYTSLKSVAKQAGVGIDTIRRRARELELEILSLDSLGQAKGTLFHVKNTDVSRLLEVIESKKVVRELETDSIDRLGFFYLIQLVPELMPERVKIGYTDNLEKRLGEHRCAAPTCRLLASWPCKRCWDFAAMDSITREGCELVLNEVYEGNIDQFITRGNSFFAQMPGVIVERPLSKHSPKR